MGYSGVEWRNPRTPYVPAMRCVVGPSADEAMEDEFMDATMQINAFNMTAGDW